MIKTAIENDQNMIVEGCYIPFDYEKDFEPEYLEKIKYTCLVMSEEYIKNHFDDIKGFANVIENRLDDSWCTPESTIADNAAFLRRATEAGADFILIDEDYNIEI
jgi:hypothetical protein